MNYLSHYFVNHDVQGLPAAPYFAMGVALPDMWSRFSRRQRIRWPVVRSTPLREDAPRAGLRAGMLNHVDADRWFHSLPAFLMWQRDLKRELSANRAADDVHPAVIDLLAHVSLELALDHHLLARHPDLAQRFYGAIGACDAAVVESAAAHVAGVPTAGLARITRSFQRRQFLARYADPKHMARMLRLIFAKTRLNICPPTTLLAVAIHRASKMADPAILEIR